MLDIFLYAGRAIMPLLLMMALGCGLRRVGRWSDDFYRQLNGFCFHVLLPVQLFLNVYAIEDLSVLNWRLLGFIVVCILGPRAWAWRRPRCLPGTGGSGRSSPRPPSGPTR